MELPGGVAADFVAVCGSLTAVMNREFNRKALNSVELLTQSLTQGEMEELLREVCACAAPPPPLSHTLRRRRRRPYPTATRRSPHLACVLRARRMDSS